MKKRRILFYSFICLAVTFGFIATACASKSKASENANSNSRAISSTPPVTPDDLDVANLKKERSRWSNNVSNMSQKAVKTEAEKTELLGQAKTIALNSIESAVKKLISIKTRVNNLKVIDQSFKTEISQKIDAKITILNALKADVETAKTKEEIKSIIARVKIEHKSNKTFVKEIVLAIHKTHLLGIATKLEEILEEKVGADPLSQVLALKTTALTAIEAAKTYIASGDIISAKAELKKAHAAIVDINEQGDENEAPTPTPSVSAAPSPSASPSSSTTPSPTEEVDND